MGRRVLDEASSARPHALTAWGYPVPLYPANRATCAIRPPCAQPCVPMPRSSPRHRRCVGSMPAPDGAARFHSRNGVVIDGGLEDRRRDRRRARKSRLPGDFVRATGGAGQDARTPGDSARAVPCMGRMSRSAGHRAALRLCRRFCACTALSGRRGASTLAGAARDTGFPCPRAPSPGRTRPTLNRGRGFLPLAPRPDRERLRRSGSARQPRRRGRDSCNAASRTGASGSMR